MSLMSLSPEVVRLRRIAKACQAGELSRLEYRESRRQVIKKFADGRTALNEDTVPRFDLEATLQRGVMTPAQLSGSHLSNVASSRFSKLIWGCVVLALVASLFIPTWVIG